MGEYVIALDHGKTLSLDQGQLHIRPYWLLSLLFGGSRLSVV